MPDVPHRDIVLDTDAASLLQRGRAPEWIRNAVPGRRVWLTFVTVGELWKWAETRAWGQPRVGRLESWIARRPIIPYDHHVARTWGRLAGASSRRGRPRPQNDTWVAACCVRHGVPLVTLNRRDYQDFVDHDGLVLLGDE